MRNERALSDTVSVIFVIILVIALAILTAAAVFGLAIFQQKSAFIAPNFSHEAVTGKDVIRVFNRGGDTAYLNLSEPVLYPMSVYVDTNFGIFRALPVNDVDKFAPGTTFYLYYNQSTGLFNITDNPAGLNVAAASFPNGVTGVHLIDEHAHLMIAQWGIPGIQAAGLSVISVTPNFGYNDSLTVALSITGTGFYPGTVVFLNRTGSAPIAATGVLVVNSTLLNCTVTITHVPAGQLNVGATVPDGRTALLAAGFTVNQALPAPTVTAVSNATGSRGWPLLETITGTNFVSSSTSKLNRTGAPDIPATSCTFVSATSLRCTYDLTGVAASPPAYNLVVINPDGKMAQRAGAVTINSPAPAITSSTPATGAEAATVNITNLAGTGFQPGAVVTYANGSTTIPLTGVVVVSSTKITGTLTIPSLAPAGPYSITVLNTDGPSGTKASAFTVTSNAPTVTGITPTNANRGWPVAITNLAGTNFQPGATVKLNRTGYADIPGTGVTVVTATQITCTFSLAGVQAGAWNVVVTNPDGKQGMRANGFTVNGPTPTITSSTPATGAQAATVSITNLRGTGFQPGAIVTYNSGATSIPLTGVTVVNATSITGTLTIPDFAPAGSYSVTVTNTDGGNVTRAATFTVTSNTPTVTGIAPANANRGWPVGTTITGTNFQAGATVKLNRTGYADIPATGVTVVSATSITCTFSLAGVQSGAWNVVVTNPDGKQGMRANGFTVNAPTPTLTGSTPNTGARGATVTITNLAGTGFQPGAIVTYNSGATS
ncbi:MAG TPA: hypothetical protein VEI81_08575, partial [Methanoregula sp.]|nr:hypothetical protein [Methanoregula sp.]